MLLVVDSLVAVATVATVATAVPAIVANADRTMVAAGTATAAPPLTTTILA